MNYLWLPLLVLLWLAAVFFLYRRHRRYASETACGLWCDMLAAGLLWILVAGFFWRTLSGDVFQPADGGDLVSFLFPTYRFAAAELSRGSLPLWNPTLYAGAPFIGDIQAGFLYLPNLILFLAMPDFPYTALQWLSVLHLYWAGLGVYVLLRTVRWSGQPVSRVAALFGAVAFAFCDPLLIHLGNLNLIAVLSWMPWIVAAYAVALESGRLRAIAVTALLFALSTYAGHAQSTLYTGLALVIYTAGQMAARPAEGWGWRRRLGRPVGVLAATVALTILLAAPVLLPAAEMTRHTVRSDFTYQDTVAFSLAPTQLLAGLVTPGFFGRGPALHWSLWERVELPYLGIPVLILAIASVLVASPELRRRLWPWVGMALFGLIVALGIYGIVHGWLTVLLPLFDQFRAPARALILWALAASVLAAVGLDAIARQATRPAALTTLLRWGGMILSLAVLLSYLALLLTQADETAFLRASVAALALVLAWISWLMAWALLAAR
ncbi:MAG: hypothetical protein H3C34_16770, partial [Caldilineaceae bacterium]|nr:hypothetical protein [Caldilineaceae bacterium]